MNNILSAISGLLKKNTPVDDDFLKSAQEAGIEIEIPEVEVTEGVGADGDFFVPRLTCPSKDNKYYLRPVVGGYNKCIAGKPLYCAGSALANCVGYEWGRAYELLEEEPKLSRGNAEDWWAYKDGYPRGQEPKLGAVCVWRKGEAGQGGDGAGHVAGVEAYDKSTGIVTLSNSGYGSTTFYLTKYHKDKMDHGAYVKLGYIYIGDWEQEEETVEIELKVLRRTTPTMHDDQVGTVQILLNKRNNAKLSIDNYYGPATEKAVMAWQKKKGLPQDGVVGKATWDSLLK